MGDMEPFTSSGDPAEDYWRDFEDENEDLDEEVRSFKAEKMTQGINIKDLCDGKEVLFETGNGFLEDEPEDPTDDIAHCDTKCMRENRGAPPLNCTFEEISSRMVNLTEDGSVKKQLISSGVGQVVPENAYVTVHYNMYKESCELPFDSTYLRNRPEKFRLGQGETLLGLECAIKSMKKDENSIFFIKWEMAFGAMGCPDRIERECDIVVDVTLVNFMEIQAGDALTCLSEADVRKIEFTKFINQAKKMLCNGSDDFSKGETRDAIVSYRKGLKILNSIRLQNEEQESIMLKEKLKCLVNLAVCYNKLGKHEPACVACKEALSIDSNCAKANFHYGRANLGLSNFSVAQKFLFKANRLKPNDKDIHNELKKLEDKKALHELQDKTFWKKAFFAEKGESKDEPSALEKFEEELLSSLQESKTEGKSYALPLPLSEDERAVCNRVAAKLNVNFETQSQFCVFKAKEKPKEKEGQ